MPGMVTAATAVVAKTTTEVLPTVNIKTLLLGMCLAVITLSTLPARATEMLDQVVAQLCRVTMKSTMFWVKISIQAVS